MGKQPLIPTNAATGFFRRVADAVKRRVSGPETDDYKRRLEGEQAHFKDCEVVHDLPPIFHYWSNKHLLPLEQAFGIENPEHFFLVYTLRQLENCGEKQLQIVSLGTGNCDMEVKLAAELLAHDQTNFEIECIDINRDMLDRGSRLAAERGVGAHFRFERGDFNRWKPGRQYDVVIANQALHHVLELEHLFESIRNSLSPDGVFLASDIIGRNGHRKWPEARRVIDHFWEELPSSYRFNRQLQRQEDTLIDHDCSGEGFEGIRAQDILPLLVKNFHFELFIPFASIILPFIDRSFGPNFDAAGEWDRDFIDRVHARDQEGMLSGELKPTQMLAVLRNEPVETKLVHPNLTPEFCIRDPDVDEISPGSPHAR